MYMLSFCSFWRTVILYFHLHNSYQSTKHFFSSGARFPSVVFAAVSQNSFKERFPNYLFLLLVLEIHFFFLNTILCVIPDQQTKSVLAPGCLELFTEVGRVRTALAGLSVITAKRNYVVHFLLIIFSNFVFQVCLVMIVINMAVRCDITSVVYAIWLGAFLVLGRQNSSIVWPVYVGFLAVLLPLQYLLVLGWPPALCLGENNQQYFDVVVLNVCFTIDNRLLTFYVVVSLCLTVCIVSLLVSSSLMTVISFQLIHGLIR